MNSLSLRWRNYEHQLLSSKCDLGAIVPYQQNEFGTIYLVLNRSRSRALAGGILGALLLAGSGATFAMWNVQTSIPFSLDIGYKSVAVADSFHWYDVSDTETVCDPAVISQPGAARIHDLPNYVFVPGDCLFAYGTVHTDLSGNDLEAVLTAEHGLPNWVTSHVQFIDPITGDLTNRISQTSGSYQIGVQVLLDFNPELEQMNQPLDLSDLRLVLQQSED